MKTCIAVLTRGYPDMGSYHKLIQRNRSISEHLQDRTIPLLFFHEGNILPHHQTYIAQQTPELTMHFVDIVRDGRAFRQEKNSVQLTPSLIRWAPGNYCHMCSFWFVDFWTFVRDYDLMVRIDEDCVIHASLDHVMERLRTAPEPAAVISGQTVDDRDFVCVDMNAFTMRFMREQVGKEVPPKDPPNGPYTNFIGLRLDRLREHDVLIGYVQAVDHSNHIYRHRWGDLPLWGEAITYILGDDALIVDPQIKYYHESHNIHVNPST